jgi:hypothetical protein
MRVKAHELKPPGEERAVHFTSLLYHPGEEKVFVGLTDHGNDLLYTFDPKTSEFESCGFKRISDKYDVKIHRSLVLAEDGSILGATACLHDVRSRPNGQGGKIFRYTPSSGDIEVITRPVEHDYVQSILYDAGRKVVYGFTYPVSYFFRHDLDTGKTSSHLINSLPHLPAMDNAGRVWGTWEGQNSLFSYDPDADEMTWHQVKLPRLQVSHTAGAPADPGQVDCLLNGKDGYVYIGSVSGALFRLDPDEVEVEYLGKPVTGLRMAALTLGHDGLIYGIGGMGESNRLFSYDREEDQFRILGAVHDPDRDDYPYITHHIVSSGPDTFFSGETDNPKRGGYLWETQMG